MLFVCFHGMVSLKFDKCIFVEPRKVSNATKQLQLMDILKLKYEGEHEVRKLEAEARKKEAEVEERKIALEERKQKAEEERMKAMAKALEQRAPAAVPMAPPPVQFDNVERWQFD